ncbi:DUF3035 domain-containing protein [Palleronia sp.]|uniref:DUF3035 domain-containing protein n=1 Tax=Palleronia sp. TaxID=1940284 RepID=UPI0035C7F4D6
MTTTLRFATLALVAALAGCGGAGEPDLIRPVNSGNGPDEFSIVPNKPLEQPQSLVELPPPTPGGSNRTDQTPQADAIAALGGNPGALAGPVQGPELIRYAGRFGVESGIRTQLAAEDRAFRETQSGRLLERMFGTTTYYRAYRNQSLDQYQELQRLRQQGVRTPSAPPEG